MKTAYLALLAAIACEVIATSSLKASEGFTKPAPSVVVVIGYALSFYLLGRVLTEVPVGIAYAVWSGIGIVLITIAGFLVFRQVLDLPALAGIGIIMAGVLVISLFSQTTTA